jgi:hypothetical protein
MSLNWNLTKMANWEALTEGDEWRITDSLIWATMAVGIHTITLANYEEFHARVSLWERLVGPYMVNTEDKKPMYITLNDVKRRIGLSTNAGTKTRKQFNDGVLKRWYSKESEGTIV